MFKLTAIALSAITLFAAPALAMTTPTSVTVDSFNKEHVIASLQQRGVNAQDVERWGSFIRAFVKQADGTVKSELFKPDTLTPATNLADAN